MEKPVKVKRKKPLATPKAAVKIVKSPKVKPEAATPATKVRKVKGKTKIVSPKAGSLSPVQNSVLSVAGTSNATKRLLHTSTPKVKKLRSTRGIPFLTAGISRRITSTPQPRKKAGNVVTGKEKILMTKNMEATTENKAKRTVKETTKTKAATQAITETKAKATMKKTTEAKTAKKASDGKDSNTIPGTSNMKTVKKKTIAGNKIQKAEAGVTGNITPSKLIDDIYEAISAIGVPRIGASSQAIKSYIYNKRREGHQTDFYQKVLYRRINLILRQAIENGELIRPAHSKVPVGTVSANGRFILPKNRVVKKNSKEWKAESAEVDESAD